ncbi:MAG TPA: hypothetical protein PK784_06570 [Tenuifilaceae bacterium]|nr:hypothetical protein [Tenuifilaceae bacterium]
MKIIKATLAIALFYATTLLLSVNFVLDKINGVQLIYNLIFVCALVLSILILGSFEKYFKKKFRKRIAYLMLTVVIILVIVFNLFFYYYFKLIFKFDVEVWPIYWLLIMPSVYLIVHLLDLLDIVSKDPR